jgi:hypothetical protein
VSAARVILLTVAGPAGQMDVGVRSDATPAELAASLGDMLGVGPARPVAEHRSPPRPGSRLGERALLSLGTSLAAAGVADGDLLLFRRPEDATGLPAAPPPSAMRDPLPAAHPAPVHGTHPGQAGALPPAPPPFLAAPPRVGPLARPAPPHPTTEPWSPSPTPPPGTLRDPLPAAHPARLHGTRPAQAGDSPAAPPSRPAPPPPAPSRADPLARPAPPSATPPPDAAAATQPVPPPLAASAFQATPPSPADPTAPAGRFPPAPPPTTGPATAGHATAPTQPVPPALATPAPPADPTTPADRFPPAPPRAAGPTMARPTADHPATAGPDRAASIWLRAVPSQAEQPLPGNTPGLARWPELEEGEPTPRQGAPEHGPGPAPPRDVWGSGPAPDGPAAGDAGAREDETRPDDRH